MKAAVAQWRVPEQEDPGRVSEATPAATVVPIRDGAAGLEVLMLRRDARGAFGGMWVFPGGKVDPRDLHPEGKGSPDERELWAARRAAVREAAEEAGLAIAERDSGDPVVLDAAP